MALDIRRPYSAGMYDFPGGMTNFEPDRVATEQALAGFPQYPVAACGNRAFMHRTTRMLAQSGVTQFLDIPGPRVHSAHHGARRRHGVRPARRREAAG
ncbi:SAM-dependent methyltransferase [Kitasatospora sp. NPDC059327]|uniref:SAM-dependent methyltransferase n=1 Tax=Kitasatospora sp. NPDC059327 TaxID=3346803 RepID=UPI0036A9E53D